ncbi:MAG: RcpC/CpaB family pilus assembly protein [Chloroflexota bacterium]
MNKRQNGKRLIMIGIGLVVLVIGAEFVLTCGGGSSPPPAVAADQTPLLVAQQTIPAGTVFSQGEALTPFFLVKQVPVSVVPFGGYHSTDQVAALTHTGGCGPVRAAGCAGQLTSTQTIFQGEPIVEGMFSTLGQYRQAPGPSFAIPYGFVGIAVNFNADNSVLGSIQSCDTIDLIASWKGGKIGKKMVDGQPQFALNDLRVISVNQPPAISGSSPSAPANAPAAGGSVVLLVRYQQALEIQHLKDFGWQLSCVLRSAKQAGILHFKTLPVTDKWFFVKTANGFKSNPGY